MFRDYYKILNIPFGVDITEIKKAYRAQSLKWHPDKHQDEDVTSIMQDINEAYAILKDPVTKQRYDNEYLAYLKYKREHSVIVSDTTQENKREDYQEYDYQNDYKVQDAAVEEDMKAAREYARELVKEFFDSLKKNASIAVEGAWEGVKGYVYAFIILSIIGLLIALFSF